MATEIDFSMKALTDTARRHIRVFQIHQFLDRFALGLTVAVVPLALTDRGMDLLQISLLFGIYSLTTMANGPAQLRRSPRMRPEGPAKANLGNPRSIWHGAGASIVALKG